LMLTFLEKLQKNRLMSEKSSPSTQVCSNSNKQKVAINIPTEKPCTSNPLFKKVKNIEAVDKLKCLASITENYINDFKMPSNIIKNIAKPALLTSHF